MLISDTESFILGYQVGRRMKGIETIQHVYPPYYNFALEAQTGADLITEDEEDIMPEAGG